MFESYYIKHLKEGEEIIRIVRRFYLTYAFHLTIAILIVLMAFFFLFPLFRLGPWGVFGFFLIIVIGIFYAIRQTIIYYLNGLVITKERILDFDQRGLFDRVVSESTYEKIQDVSFKVKGVWQTFFNFGDIEIQTAAAQANLEVKNVARPQNIQDIIVQLQRKTALPPQDLTASELVHMVSKIKKGLGEDKFKELIEKSEKKAKKRKPRR